LGKLNVDSGLGEPLKAQIDLLSVTPDELSTLTAAIASEEAYAVQGIPRLGVHNNIKVELAKNPDGSPVLRLRSLQPIDDPYLDMLIQVDWASGRLLREYTILLDPPGYKQSLSEEPGAIINKPATSTSGSSVTQSGANVSTSSQQAGNVAKATKKSVAKTVKASEQPESSTQPVEAYELTTQRGDTLNSIAKEVQAEGVSLDQMLVGLFDANKNAFVDGNMNRL
jgi:pilus assembly protein FimV